MEKIKEHKDIIDDRINLKKGDIQVHVQFFLFFWERFYSSGFITEYNLSHDLFCMSNMT